MSGRITDDNDPYIPLKKGVKILIYTELFLLLFLCNSNNYIIKEKKDEIIEKLEISKEDTTIYTILLQSGRIIGVIFIIFYFLYSKRLKHIQYLIFISIFFKSVSFLIYYNDLNKESIIYVQLSIFSQGLFHSFIGIYLPIWTNHFISGKYKLLLLSISFGASPLSNIFGIIFFKFISESIQYCFLTLSILIIIFDLIFLLTVTKNCCFKCDDISLDYYFNSLVSQKENLNEFAINDDKNIDMEEKKKKNYKLIFCSENKCAFISIVLARALLKFSFVGINYCIKDYFKELDGDGELNESIIFYVPLIGLFIGALLSFFDWFKKNGIILIISVFIGFFGTLTSVLNNKLSFIIFLIGFYGFTNLMLPSLIQKSFDCFKDEQLSEISYAFNCIIYLLIGNLFSSFLNFISENKILMIIYLNVVWINFFLIFIYKIKMDRKNAKRASSNSLIPVNFNIEA